MPDQVRHDERLLLDATFFPVIPTPFFVIPAEAGIQDTESESL